MKVYFILLKSNFQPRNRLQNVKDFILPRYTEAYPNILTPEYIDQ